MENDPLYQQGLQSFGRGEWAEAAACFTQLQIKYPADLRVTQFLETARLRAAMSTGVQRSVQLQARSGWMRRLPLLAAFLLLVAVGVGVYLAYQAWAVPAQNASVQQANIEKLRQAAQVQIASGQYASAIKSYQDILAQAPDDPVAAANLERARRLEQAAQLYTQATQALNAGNEAEALKLLEQINTLESGYRDTVSLLDRVKSTLALSQSYDKALALVQANNWTEAAKALETLRATNPNYRSQEIQENLFKIYLQLGNQQFKQATTIAAVEVAQGFFQKALTMRPLDPEADTARRLAETFLDGAAAYQIKNWDLAIRKLSPVYEQQRDLFGGQIGPWLYDAFMKTGETFLAQNDPFSARDRFAQAVSLAPSAAQKAEAQKRYEAANQLTTPTSTIRPSPTIIPTGTPLPAGYVAPSWTRSTAATPEPYLFAVINRTYMPNTITGHSCQWAGVAGRIFDMRGAPLTAPTLGVRVDGPELVGVAAGTHQVIGPSGWLVQFDVVPKVLQGTIQVFYKDQPASAQIPYTTRGSCYENLLIVDIQQIKPLP